MASKQAEIPIKVPSCHLYTLEPSRRVTNELLALGIDPNGTSPLDVVALNKIDGMRYEGDRGTDIFRKYLDEVFGEDTEISVLDVGSGFGGPSRLLAFKRAKTKIVALEYVPEISAMAKSLTARCEVSKSIEHITGDVSASGREIVLNGGLFQATQAVLSLLHVVDIETALGNISQKLESNGILYLEDFCIEDKEALSEQFKKHLTTTVGCPRSPMTIHQWHAALIEAGLRQINIQNVTAVWKPWIHERACNYKAELDRHVEIQGREGAMHMLEFYQTMDYLFSTGLQGCRITARK